MRTQPSKPRKLVWQWKKTLCWGVMILLLSCTESKPPHPTPTQTTLSNQSDLATELIDRNLGLLQSGHPLKMRIAAAKLGALQAKRAIKLLTQIVLDDSDRNLVRVALIALGNIGDANSFSVIKDKLTHRDPEIQKAAIQALAKYQGNQVGTAFEKLMRSSDPAILNTTLSAMRLSADETFRWFHTKTLIDSVRLAIESNNPEVAQEALQVLARFPNTHIVSACCAVLNTNKYLTVKIQAARILGRLGSEQAKTCLKRLSQTKDPRLACVVAGAIAKQGEPAFYSDLVSCLQSNNKEVRFTTISELGDLGGIKAQKILAKHIAKETDFNVRRHCVRVLSRIRSAAK